MICTDDKHLSPKIRDEIIAYARMYLGVRWRHQGRSTRGIDCIGLIIVVAEHFGFSYEEMAYPKGTQGHRFINTLLQHTARKPILDRLPGDMLVMRDKLMPCHIAIVTGEHTLIHATIHNKRVVEERLESYYNLLTHCLQYLPVSTL